MKVVIIGGGPAGSLCAMRLLREAESAGRSLRVVILEAKPFRSSGPAGCNFCAGVITTGTIERLRQLGIELPEGVVQRRIDSFRFCTEGGVTGIGGRGQGKIYSVFRGGGPAALRDRPDISFDRLLLRRTEELGATVRRQLVKGVERGGTDGMIVRTADGNDEGADVVVGAFGVNSALAGRLASIGYRPPPCIRVCQAEVAMDRESIDRHFGNQIFAFVVRHPTIRFLAVTPKRHYLTLTAVGRNVSLEELDEYLRHPLVAPHFPGVAGRLVASCRCHPMMPIGEARGAVSDRFVAIGDAYVTRYYKNGIGSAYFTAAAAARAIVNGGISRRRLTATYRPQVRRRFGMSNRCGKFLFYLSDLTYKMPWLAQAMLAYLEREKVKSGGARPLNNLMWSLFVGDRSYSALTRRALSPSLVGRLILWNIRWVAGKVGKWIRKALSGH